MVVDTYLPLIRRQRFWGLLASAGILGLAFVLRYALPLHLPFVTFYPAILIATFVAGRWAGVMVTAIATLLGWWFFLPPEGSMVLAPGVLLDVIAFVTVGLLIVLVGDSLATALDRLEASRIRYQELLREMAHRLKNQYAVLFAITRSVKKEAESAEDFDQLLTEKLRGLASSHDLLVSGNWSGASIAELVNAHLLPFCGPGRFRASGGQVKLDPLKVQYLGMALHELATNALKHGALTDETGHIDIVWKDNDKGLTLIWQEHCSPAVAAGDLAKGFGYKVLTALVPAALNGTSEIEYLPAGLRWSINVPGPRSTA